MDSLRTRRKICVWASIAALVFPVAPRNASAFAVYGLAGVGGEVHQDMTREALRQASLKLGAGQSFTEQAIMEIVEANRETDDHQDVPEWHCDNNALELCSRHIEDNKKGLIAALSDSTPISTSRALELRQSLGTTLHTIQDFYSHSNWIENHPNATADFLGEPATIPRVDGTAITPNCALNDTSHPIPLALIGEFAQGILQSANAPRFECAHGLLGNGMHKDWAGRERFPDARARAIESSVDFIVSKIVAKATNAQSVCMFVGNEKCGGGLIAYFVPSLAGVSPSKIVEKDLRTGAVVRSISLGYYDSVGNMVYDSAGSLYFVDLDVSSLTTRLMIATAGTSQANPVSGVPSLGPFSSVAYDVKRNVLGICSSGSIGITSNVVPPFLVEINLNDGTVAPARGLASEAASASIAYDDYSSLYYLLNTFVPGATPTSGLLVNSVLKSVPSPAGLLAGQLPLNLPIVVSSPSQTQIYYSHIAYDHSHNRLAITSPQVINNVAGVANVVQDAVILELDLVKNVFTRQIDLGSQIYMLAFPVYDASGNILVGIRVGSPFKILVEEVYGNSSVPASLFDILTTTAAQGSSTVTEGPIAYFPKN